MKKSIIIILGFSSAFILGYFFNTFISRQAEKKVEVNIPVNVSEMTKVTGIGGIFFKCQDPEKVKEWYKTHLGFNTDDYGARFEWWEKGDTSKTGSLQWSTFSANNSYFTPSVKEFMINYRVKNITTLAEQLKTEGVTILDSIETYEYGKFLHIMDIEGNKIELWEPDYNYGKTVK